MFEVGGSTVMVKKTPAPAPSPPEDDRVTVLNLKGLTSEKDFIKTLSRKTGVSASEIARRGMAMWAVSRGFRDLPENWVEE